MPPHPPAKKGIVGGGLPLCVLLVVLSACFPQHMGKKNQTGLTILPKVISSPFIMLEHMVSSTILEQAPERASGQTQKC